MHPGTKRFFEPIRKLFSKKLLVSYIENKEESHSKLKNPNII